MTEFTFINKDTTEEMTVEADGFEEASYLMFGDDEYKPIDWELYMVDDEYV